MTTPYLNLARLKSDANEAKTLQNLLSNFTWQKSSSGYRAKEHGSYSIYRKSGKWLFCAHNGDFKGGDPLTIAAEIHGLDLKKATDLHQAAALVCEAANLKFAHYCSDEATQPQATPQRRIETPQTKVWIPNASGEAVKMSFKSYEIAEIDSDNYKALATFLGEKTGIKAADLHKNGVFPLKSVISFNNVTQYFKPENKARAYVTEGGANVKFKWVLNGKKHTFYFKNNGNYVYSSMLPTNTADRKNIILVICEGEDDAICINQIDPSKYAAITGGSASANFGEDWINLLKSQFASVVTFYDNDKAGRKGSIKNAQKHGLPFVSIVDFDELTTQNDVCDIYKNLGAYRVKYLLDFTLRFRRCDNSETPNLETPCLDYLALSVEKYLSEQTNYLKFFLAQNDRLLLKSATGTGKTTFCIELSKDAAYLEKLGVKRILFAVPRTALGDNTIHKKCRELDVNAVFIDGKADKNDLEAAANSAFSVWTYDQLPKAAALMGDSLLIVDELHKIEKDNAFRGDVCNDVFAQIPHAKRVLAMSATPIFEMCLGSQLNEKLDESTRKALSFKLLKVESKQQQRKLIEPVFYDVKSKQIDVLMHHCRQNAQHTEGGVNVVFLNDRKKLEAAAQQLNDEQYPGFAAVLCSKSKDQSDIYERLKNGEALPESLKFLFCTSLLDCGVDFNFEVSTLAILGKFDTGDTAQAIGRPRHGKANSTVNVYRYFSVDKDEKDTVFFDFEEKRKENDFNINTRETALQTFETVLKCALMRCDRLNEVQAVPTSEAKYLDETNDVYYSESQQKWLISYPSVFSEYTRLIEKRKTKFGYFDSITRLDNTAEILPPRFVTIEKDKATGELLKEKKEAAKATETAAFEFTAAYPNAAFEIVGRATRDKDLRDEIKTKVTLTKELSDEAATLKTEFGISANDLQKAVIRRLLLEKMQPKFRDFTKKEVPTVLLGLQSDTDFEVFYNRLCTFDDLSNATDGRGFYRANNANKLILAISEAKNRKRSKCFFGAELVKIVSKATGEAVDLNRAKMRVSELFNVEKSLNDKRQTVYKIGERLTIKKVISNAQKPKNGS